MNTEYREHTIFVWMPLLEPRYLDDFYGYKMSIELYSGKSRGSTLWLSRPTYGRRGVRAQQNTDRLCVVFNLDRGHDKKKTNPFETRFYGNCEYHNGTNADRIWIRSVVNNMMSIPFITSCNFISLKICRLPKPLKSTIDLYHMIPKACHYFMIGEIQNSCLCLTAVSAEYLNRSIGQKLKCRLKVFTDYA